MRSLTYNNITWHDSAERNEEELRKLQEQYSFHELDIEDCLSEHERPKVEEYDDYLFLVFHIPYLHIPTRRVLKEEVNIFVGQTFMVTVHEGKISILDTLWKELEENESIREEYLKPGTGFFLYQLMRSFFDGIFPLVDTTHKQIRRVEETLFESDEQADILRDIMTLKRNIISMRSILLPQRSLIATLEHKNKKFVSEELALYFDDILDAIERQWSLLDTAKEMIDALQETHESWLSHRTNSIVRTLTLVSVTMLPLTFITGLYGMNINLPVQDHTKAFLLLITIMIVIVVSMLFYFRKKRWF